MKDQINAVFEEILENKVKLLKIATYFRVIGFPLEYKEGALFFCEDFKIMVEEGKVVIKPLVEIGEEDDLLRELLFHLTKVLEAIK